MDRHHLVLTCAACALSLSPVACGGDRADRDLAYAVDFCTAAVEFQRASGPLKPAGAWTDDRVDALAAVYRRWADALDDLDPPGDVRDFQLELIAAVRTAADQLSRGTPPAEAIRELGELSYPEPAGGRLRGVAQDVEQCAAAGFWFDRPLGVI